MEKRDILEALRSYKKMKKVEFAEFLGLSPQSYYDWLLRNSFDIDRLHQRMPEITAHFLLTGEGDMLIGSSTARQAKADSPRSVEKGKADGCFEDTKPLIPLNLYNENSVNVAEYVSKHPKSLNYSPTVRNIASYDLVYSVITDALAPHIKPGDRLALKRMRQGATIINGLYYVLDTEDNGLVLRLLYDEPTDPDVYVCKSLNDRYTEVKIPKKEVYDVYKVVGLLRASTI